MFFVFFAFNKFFVSIVSCCEAVDEEPSKKLKVGSHSVTEHPAVVHDLVDFVRALIGLG